MAASHIIEVFTRRLFWGGALCEVFTQMGVFTTEVFRQISPVLSKVEWKVTVTVHTCVPVPGIRSSYPVFQAS